MDGMDAFPERNRKLVSGDSHPKSFVPGVDPSTAPSDAGE